VTTVGLRELFGPLLGNWTGIEELAGSGSEPATSARAALIFKVDVADLVVVQDYRQVRADGREYLAHGVFMIDSSSAGLRWWLFDSEGQPPVVAEGGWQDGEMILQKAGTDGIARHCFTVTDDRLSYRISITQGNSGEQEILTGSYRRISGH
jgi:hypothetical protein